MPEHLTVSVEHLRRNIPTIMAKVEGGRATVTLTSYGRSVAQIVPVRPSRPECGKLVGNAEDSPAFLCGLRPDHDGPHLPF